MEIIGLMYSLIMALALLTTNLFEQTGAFYFNVLKSLGFFIV